MRSLKHHGPDKILETMVAALSEGKWMEFDDLYEVVRDRIFGEKPGEQAEEKLKLRVYERLQELFRKGHLVRIWVGTEKKYRMFGSRTMVQQG